MSDDLISEQALRQKIDKIKVSSAEIVVNGTKEKPYFEIKYFDLSDNEMHIGFSSYKLDVVFGYLEKYFDIVEKDECEDDYPYNDLISRKAVIEAVDRHTRDDGTLDDDISVILEEVETAFDKEKVIEQLHRCRVYQFQGTLPDGRVCHFSDVIEIVEKGGIE